MLRIINWNIKRLEDVTSSKVEEVIDNYNPDIVILTETNTNIKLKSLNYNHHSAQLPKSFDGIPYKDGEIRTAIYSKYPIIKRLELNDNYTNCAVFVSTPLGNIVVYATIIGIFGNKGGRFAIDFQNMFKDIESLSANNPMIVAGDFNQSFSDNYYFTHDGRRLISDMLDKMPLCNVTSGLPQNVDHILISNEIAHSIDISTKIFNVNKIYSDHIGIVVDI